MFTYHTTPLAARRVTMRMLIESARFRESLDELLRDVDARQHADSKLARIRALSVVPARFRGVL